MRALVLALALLAARPAAAGERYDIVLKGGRVMDPESGLDAIRDVGVSGGKVAAVSTTPLAGRRTIDARGKVVAPGFIDLHSHAQTLLGSRVQAFDGVTTALEAEVGQWPIDAAYAKAAGTRAINYGFTVSWSLARIAVMTDAKPDGAVQGISAALETAGDRTGERATEAQNREIMAMLRKGLDDGAVGIGLALGYMPGATEAEVADVAKLAADRKVEVFVHMRSTASDFAATQEVIADATVTGSRWRVMHVYWANPAQIAFLETARARGVGVTPETLGWFNGSTYIGAAFFAPEVMRAAGRPPERILYYGRPVASYEELGALRKADPQAFVITLDRATDETDPALRAEIARRLTTPGWVLASDAMPWTAPSPTRYLPDDAWPLPADAWSHPRSAATYTRILQKYVREWKLVGLMDVLRAGSLEPAREMEAAVPAFRAKGRVKVGADADLIVFDPERIEAAATLEHPATLARGMDYVMVGGTVLIDGGRLDVKAKPGAPVRR